LIEYTQSNLKPGNCWQTAIACILEVDPIKLPPQHELEAIPKSSKLLGGWGMYSNILNAYLKKHHGLVYSEVYSYQFNSVQPLRRWHTMNGPTVRTSELRESKNYHVNHCVVAYDRNFIWDVHPSRAGLLKAESWGVLGERQPDVDQEKWADNVEYQRVWSCLCPACGLEELRRLLSNESSQVLSDTSGEKADS
jgi:hypothetical protein